MKNYKLFFSVLTLICLSGGVFYACQKDNSAAPAKVAVVAKPDPKPTPNVANCCNITCSNGSKCSAGTGPCNCKCDWAGDADCSGGGTKSNISGPTSLNNYYTGLIELLHGFQKPYADDAASHLDAVRDLFVASNYDIEAQNDIMQYAQHVAAISSYEAVFTAQEMQSIAIYKAEHPGQ